MKNIQDFDSFGINEDKIKYITTEKMFGDIKKALSEIERSPEEAAAKYFGSNKKQGQLNIMSGTLSNLVDGMSPDEAFGESFENADTMDDKIKQEVINVLYKEFNIIIRQK